MGKCNRSKAKMKRNNKTVSSKKSMVAPARARYTTSAHSASKKASSASKRASSTHKKESNKGTEATSTGETHNNQEETYVSHYTSDDAVILMVSSEKDLSDNNAEHSDRG